MPFAEIYRRQAQLLIDVIPLVAEEKCFALKGGTAINLFVRDMPRLSVDIDLTYAHRRFLISFKKGTPEWDLLGMNGIADLPAVKWKAQNLDKLSAEKRAQLVLGLEKALIK